MTPEDYDMKAIRAIASAKLLLADGDDPSIKCLGKQNSKMPDLLRIKDYPQLALLAWNRVTSEITGEDAFALYEHNWRFVDLMSLNLNEAALIDRLKMQYGKGVLNV